MAKSSCAIVLLLLVAFASNASAADLFCADKSGKLSIRSACKKGERIVNVGVPGPQGPSGPKGEKGDPGPSAPSVFDSTGRRIGLVMGRGCPLSGVTEGQLAVHTIGTIAGKLYHVCFTPSGYPLVSTGEEVYYTSSDCSGDAFIPLGRIKERTQGVIPSALVFPPQQTLYDYDESDLPSDVNYNSFVRETGPCVVSSGVLPLVPIARVADINEIFVPPIEVR